VGDITALERQDPRIALFEQKNPGWAAGDELACLAELQTDNFRRSALRLLSRQGTPC
jgi:hypothetical protein